MLHFYDIRLQKRHDLEIGVSGHSRSFESGTIRQIVYGFLLVFFSNFVPKTHHFWDIRLQKCCDLEDRVRVHQGHWKCQHAV